MPAEVTRSTLTSIKDSYEEFQKQFSTYAKEVCWDARMQPRIGDFRLRDAHLFWVRDLERVEKGEPKLVDGLDHFKQSGHLAYWLRRCAPVVEFSDYADMYEASAGPISEDGKALRELLFKYGTEYLAFDWGFQICLFYEKFRTDKNDRDARRVRVEGLKITDEYLDTICHFMKCKHVSPHALTLIYMSLFQ